MLVKLWSSALHGIEAKPIRIELIYQGIDTMVGYLTTQFESPGIELKTAKTLGYSMPRQKSLTLASDLRKKLLTSIALGILGASGQIDMSCHNT